MPVVKVILPPINKPIIDRKTGLCDTEWFRFFEQVRNRIGGDTDLIDSSITQITLKANGSFTINVGNGLTGGGNLAGTSLTLAAKEDTGWTAGTGTPSKGAFAAYAGQSISAAFVQAEIQALDNAAKAVSQRLLALEQALTANGAINA